MQASPETITRSKLESALAALPALAQALGEDAAERELRRELPVDRFALFRASGLGVLRFPIEWGGLGGSLEDLFHVVSTLAAHESNVAHALRIHYDQTEQLLLSPRSSFNDTQIERIKQGAMFGGASTELGTSRPGEIVTKLVRDGEHFRVTGKKYYSTGTAFADYARINVQDENGENVSFIVPSYWRWHGVSELQSLSASDGAGEHHRSARCPRALVAPRSGASRARFAFARRPCFERRRMAASIVRRSAAARAIARALALKPKVLLFDEPTSALDPELVNEVLDVIKALARSGTAMVIVTHEIGFAREVADTIVSMDGGRVIEQGPPSNVLAVPQHARTREFLSRVL
ncbi:AAA family ATPase [Paraburkholderia kirstenboschensis]